MGKIDAWVPKIPRLKNAKVSRFSYRDAAYTNDDIEGVENYDYARNMNVPSLNKTDTEASVLDAGARAQFSSLSKNALNHFFGRVSYNLNKVIDFLSDFLDDFIAFQETNTDEHDTINTNYTNLVNSFVDFSEVLLLTSSTTLNEYPSGTTKRLYNAVNYNITITLPTGTTYNGNSSLVIVPKRLFTILLVGNTWVNANSGFIDNTIITGVTQLKDSQGRSVGIINSTETTVAGVAPKSMYLSMPIKALSLGNTWKYNRTLIGISKSIIFKGTRAIATSSNGCFVSDDYGITWVQKSTMSNIEGCVVSGNRLIAVGYGGVCLVSDNNGDTWVQKPTGITNWLRDVVTVGGRLIAVGNDGICIVSTDNGNTWTTRDTGVTAILYCITVSSTRLLALGASGTCIVSDNFGDIWVTKSTGLGGYVCTDVIALGNDRVITVASGSSLATSDNNGDTWVSNQFGLTDTLNRILRVGDRLVILGLKGICLISEDDGNLWNLNRIYGKYNDIYTAAYSNNILIALGNSDSFISDTKLV